MAAYRRVYDSRHLQAKNRDQLRNPTLGNRVKGKGTQFNDSIYQRKVSASRQLGVNNLPRVVVRSRALAGDRTRDLLIASPTPYRCASTPPSL